jgi:caa(3)-type oxidase subunit IV
MKVPPKYILAGIWVILQILLFSMFGFAHLPLHAAGPILILTFAFTQMLLVMLFFMRLRKSPKMIWLFSAAGFFWLFILITLVASDYLTRNWH